MLTILLPYIKLYRLYFYKIVLGMVLMLLTLFASVFLLLLSGWFLAATAFVGFAGLYTFNYMLPAAGVRGAAIIRTAARYFERLVNHNTTFKILAYLRIEAFKKILPLSANQLAQYQKADLLNRFVADIDNLDHLYLRLFTPIISGLFITLFIYLGLSLFSQTIAVLIALFLLVVILVLPIVFYHAGKTLGVQITEQKSQYRQALVSYLHGQAELTIFNAKAQYRQQLDQLEQTWQQNQTKQATLVSLSTALVIFIIGIMIAAIIWLSTHFLPDHNQPIIALFIFVGLSCTEVLAPIASAFIFLGQVISSAERMNQLNNQNPDITFVPTGPEFDFTQCSVSFNNIKFSYPNQPFNLFEQVNIEIKNGEHVALIGQTGCGKSTLLNLLTRFWQPTEGKIKLNNINIEQLDEPTLRSAISVIPQSIMIFSDTLRNNLLIAKPEATDDELIAVLKSTELDKLLVTEDKLDLWLGDGGRALSGGEKRRIGIARALLHNAPLTLMDEPTESLDQTTEQQILTIIEKCYQDKTLLMVTHRLIDHPFFDRTLVMKDKRVSEVV